MIIARDDVEGDDDDVDDDNDDDNVCKSVGGWLRVQN